MTTSTDLERLCRQFLEGDAEAAARLRTHLNRRFPGQAQDTHHVFFVEVFPVVWEVQGESGEETRSHPLRCCATVDTRNQQTVHYSARYQTSGEDRWRNYYAEGPTRADAAHKLYRAIETEWSWLIRETARDLGRELHALRGLLAALSGTRLSAREKWRASEPLHWGPVPQEPYRRGR